MTLTDVSTTRAEVDRFDPSFVSQMFVGLLLVNN